jgi:hypothetical protein
MSPFSTNCHFLHKTGGEINVYYVLCQINISLPTHHQWFSNQKTWQGGPSSFPSNISMLPISACDFCDLGLCMQDLESIVIEELAIQLDFNTSVHSLVLVHTVAWRCFPIWTQWILAQLVKSMQRSRDNRVRRNMWQWYHANHESQQTWFYSSAITSSCDNIHYFLDIYSVIAHIPSWRKDRSQFS